MEPVGKLVVIVGTTASGKSAAAMQIAQEHNGEIICADSRTIYRGMDIGTAKPSREDQEKVPHHLLDLVNPDEKFNVSDFQRLAKQAIEDILGRGKLPVMVGGTGLYIDSILYDFSFRPVNQELRQELESLTVSELQARIAEQGLELPQNAQNPRHLVRVLEAGGFPSKRKPLRANTLLLGLHWPDDVLKERINQRIDEMVEHGFAEEVERLGKEYGWNVQAMQAPGYKAFHRYLQGELTLEEAKRLFARNDFQLARRQRTWFKRNPDIHWQDTVNPGNA